MLQDEKIDFEDLEYVDFIENISILLGEDKENAISDIHLIVGTCPKIRKGGLIEDFLLYFEEEDGKKGILKYNPVSPEQIKNFVNHLIENSIENDERARELKEQLNTKEIDFSFSIPKVSRFRVHISKQRGSFSCCFRVIPSKIPEVKGKYPEPLVNCIKKQSGLVIISGKAGSGKSTTLATLINALNESTNKKIITIENPIEYPHRHKKSIVIQKEVGDDTESFQSGLISTLREDPDIIVVGEILDASTLETVLNAAETGHLVFTTTHSGSAEETIQRLISMFPNDKQNQIRVQLSVCLNLIVCQQLIPCQDKENFGKLIAAFEVLVNDESIKNLINKNELQAIPNQMKLKQNLGMILMKDSIEDLYSNGLISMEEKLARSVCMPMK